MSQGHVVIKINYDIHNKKLFVIMDLFKECCHYLEDAFHHVTMYIDHKNLIYFM